MPAYRRMHSGCNMSVMQSQALVDIPQRNLTSCMLIVIRMLPCNGALALLEQAFDMRIWMQVQCNTHLHGALVTHTYRLPPAVPQVQLQRRAFMSSASFLDAPALWPSWCPAFSVACPLLVPRARGGPVAMGHPDTNTPADTRPQYRAI